MLLLIKRCPHTGVTNFYLDDDPHLAVGIIARRGSDFTWHCVVGGPEQAGRAPDLETAEFCLTQYLRPAEDGRALH
jgi:hypothetical protein